MFATLSAIAAQAFYTVSDAWKKQVLSVKGFTLASFLDLGFILSMAFVAIGFVFQMYALSKLGLARTTVTVGLSAVVMSAATGMLVFKETFSPVNWLGLGLACAAVVLVNVRA